MLLHRLLAPLVLALVLLTPVCGFAQRLPGVGTNPSNTGYTYRVPSAPPSPSVFGGPTYSGFSAINPSYTGYDYPNGVRSPFLALPPTTLGVYRPMAGAGESDFSFRLNTPEDEELLRAYRPQTGSPALPVYQPRPGTSLTSALATVLPATVVVRVPPSAQVWFDDNTTRSTGPERSFETPTLTAGKTYRYEVKARWLQEGKPIEVTRRVEVHPGERTVVDFLAPNP